MIYFMGDDTPRLKERTMAYAYEGHVPSRAEIVIGMAADAIRRWCDRRELAQFVQGCSSEADRVARDLNLDTSTLMKIAARSSSGPPVLLNRRLALLGIDPEQLRRREPAVAQDLARCCALCGSKARCARDFAGKSASDHWKDYCPNEPTLAALMPQKPGLAAAH
jgi:hypothetical protein